MGDEVNGGTEQMCTRVAALDGLRGCLAVVVLCSHVLIEEGYNNWLFIPSQIAVVCFFMMSSYVLTRSWDGNYSAFLLRRFVRLWPTYAICLMAGYLLTQKHPIWSVYAWFPFLPADDPRIPDPPMWSIFLEVWMMPLMPIVVWAGTGTRKRAIALMTLVLMLSLVFKQALVFLLFVAGSFFSKATIRSGFLESAIPQWLGRISYSLYLSHVLVMWTLQLAFGRTYGTLIATALAFPAAWILWRTIEKPSIQLSRQISAAVRSLQYQFER